MNSVDDDNLMMVDDDESMFNAWLKSRYIDYY